MSIKSWCSLDLMNAKIRALWEISGEAVGHYPRSCYGGLCSEIASCTCETTSVVIFPKKTRPTFLSAVYKPHDPKHALLINKKSPYTDRHSQSRPPFQREPAPYWFWKGHYSYTWFQGIGKTHKTRNTTSTLTFTHFLHNKREPCIRLETETNSYRY